MMCRNVVTHLPRHALGEDLDGVRDGNNRPEAAKNADRGLTEYLEKILLSFA